jgi:glycosyltransferase involved in cell wall biosynthesis
MRVLVETSVLHPRFNLDVVGAERKRLGIRGAAGYTDEQRVLILRRRWMKLTKFSAAAIFCVTPILNMESRGKNFLVKPSLLRPESIPVVSALVRTNILKILLCYTCTRSASSKGVQYLLDAWESLADTIDGRLLIVGPADRDMRRILTSRRIKNMEWLGRTEDPASWYRRASVFVSPSLSDAGPRTVLEAMACGLPAIISDHCGVSRVINSGENGFVYHFDNTEELATQIEWSYRNRDELQEMGRRAGKMVANYSLSDYGGEIEQRIADLAASVNPF